MTTTPSTPAPTEPRTETLTVSEIWERRNALLDRSQNDGQFPHLAGIDDTAFTPPMSIETITATDEEGNHGGDSDEFGIDITAWTYKWMVAFSIVQGQHHAIKIAWLD